MPAQKRIGGAPFDRKNIALIGAGAIGQIHARNLAGNRNANLACIFDVKAEAAEALASKYGAQAAQDIARALGDDIDGVIIASSTASHGEIAQQCIAAGKHFLCEKPLAPDQATAAQIMAAADKAGLIAAMAFNRRFDVAYRGIKEAITRGDIGDLESIHMTSRTASPPTPQFIKTSGGLFGEKGSHFYDLARWLTGEHPVELVAMGSVLINKDYLEIGEVDTAMITLKMPSGILCQLDFSWRAAYGQDERLEVNGSQGMMQTRQSPTGPYLHYGAGGLAQDGLMPSWQQRFDATYAAELDVFLDNIETGVQELASLRDGLAAQQIADAAKLSAREGRLVSLPPVV